MTEKANQLTTRKCVPCEGGVAKCASDEAATQVKELAGWSLTHNGQRIRKTWFARDFMAAIDFFNCVAELAEQEGHHPDLHLEAYRHVTVDLWTHAIGGLSENDFILAAKIDQIPIREKSAP